MSFDPNIDWDSDKDYTAPDEPVIHTDDVGEQYIENLGGYRVYLNELPEDRVAEIVNGQLL